MKMTFKAFAKKLFGVNYDRLIRTFFIYLIIFWGLFIADLRMQIAPFILYLMVSAFTAGMMWQALSSADNAANMQNMFMLPFDSRKFVFSYRVRTLYCRIRRLYSSNKDSGTSDGRISRIKTEHFRNPWKYSLRGKCSPYDCCCLFIKEIFVCGWVLGSRPDCCYSILGK